MAQYACLIYQAEEPWAAGGPDVEAARAGFWKFRGDHLDILSAGEGLEPTSTATSLRRDSTGAMTVTDGPFVETKEALGGFYVLEAEDMAAAIELAKEIPAIFGGVEIRPVLVFS